MNRIAILELFEEHPFCSFYSYSYGDEESIEFNKFFDNFDTSEFKEDMDKILYWMNKIGEGGAHDRCFRPERGRLVAMPMETSNLRLFCYKVSDGIVLVGNGGRKKPGRLMMIQF